jgi:hypothetical protein
MIQPYSGSHKVHGCLCGHSPHDSGLPSRREPLDDQPEMKVECPRCSQIAYAHGLSDADLSVDIWMIANSRTEGLAEEPDDPIALADNVLQGWPPDGGIGPEAERRLRLQALRDELMDRKSKPVTSN